MNALDEQTEGRLARIDCRRFIPTLADESVQLVITSPPYNLGKIYEKRLTIEQYEDFLAETMALLAPKISKTGSMCWQVGNYVSNGEIIPIDIIIYSIARDLGFRLRNRIVWHFEHGLHAQRRFSGRYETIMWFTRDKYTFDLDSVRIPQKYPQKKHYKGPRAGERSGNPLGKNPGDVWIFPNVKHNHVEKTAHPCQFPIELAERLVLALSKKGDAVLDPFMGVATTALAALKHGRLAYGAEIDPVFFEIGLKRIEEWRRGSLRQRPMNRSIFEAPRESQRLSLW